MQSFDHTLLHCFFSPSSAAPPKLRGAYAESFIAKNTSLNEVLIVDYNEFN